MLRKRFEWKLRDKTLQLGEQTLIMGVLNVTPDSFSDGGKYEDPDRAFARALELEEQGADIIDIGAESTRPGSTRIPEAEELRRLVPVLKRLRGQLTVPISVDTYKSGVAAKALELGADIINDPSGLTWDPDLAKVVAARNAGLILCHMRGTPETWAKLPPLGNAIGVIAQELDAAVHRAVRSGIDRRQIVIDPGLGFGKRREQNSEVIAMLEALARLAVPVMAGPSRKHFLTKESPDVTEFATAAAITACILGGAHLVRVHDVKAMRAAVQVADEIAKSRPEAEDRGEKPAVRPPRPQAPPREQPAGKLKNLPLLARRPKPEPQIEPKSPPPQREEFRREERGSREERPPRGPRPRQDRPPGFRPSRPTKTFRGPKDGGFERGRPAGDDRGEGGFQRPGGFKPRGPKPGGFKPGGPRKPGGGFKGPRKGPKGGGFKGPRGRG